jgi:hypothetical protein
LDAPDGRPTHGQYEVELLAAQAHNQSGGLSSGDRADTYRFPVAVD